MDPVDLALLLAFDASASVSYDEFGLIAGGCAAGLRDEAVASGLTGGARRASACAVLLWSGRQDQSVVVEWTRVASPADVEALALQVEGVPRTVHPGTTAIGSALLACERLLMGGPGARRRVIDVAGDGRSNDGPPPAPIRDRLAARGVTINGLCVLHEEPDLVASYAAEVVAGADSFVLACADFGSFAEAMRRKLAREIA